MVDCPADFSVSELGTLIYSQIASQRGIHHRSKSVFHLMWRCQCVHVSSSGGEACGPSSGCCRWISNFPCGCKRRPG
jgi:hypothetical protein